ncbi:MAG: hypothetical protein M1814_006085 [Vezdaea aestivalis]|nr:MAG: hypothetical protein M1814_006085 [Vezdaea aestivalis]
MAALPYAPSPQPYNLPLPRAMSAAPAGTFAPGTRILVGRHKVAIERYLSEGGFAHVYLVKLINDGVQTNNVAVLKRVAVPDRDALTNMRTEVETMKKLKGQRYIVTYIDSHASQLKAGGFEVFLLMEYCAGGGLIDFMNTRLQNRLTEPEILHIFSDVAEGVACMHYLKPPLLHRDLKVENVLISSATNGTVRYKLCDFGSTAPPRPAPRSVVECRLIEDDVQKHTTLQYRSPEMVDVYRKLPIDEKSDIWALGVLLYKLCYYTTPFEAQGQLAILNASFKFPGYPVFSDRIKALIAHMLREDPEQRPTIYMVMKNVCSLRNRPFLLEDIYSNRSESETRRNQRMPEPESKASTPTMVGAFQAEPSLQVVNIPDIVPMRRGRPTTSSQHPQPPPKPSPSPLRNVTSDPFAALDSKGTTSKQVPPDESSSRFPTFDQFTLLQEPKGKVDFDSKPTPTTDLQQRVTQRLADDAFAQAVKSGAPTKPTSDTTAPSKALSNGQKPASLIHQPSPRKPSIGSDSLLSGGKTVQVSQRKIHRFPPSDQPSGKTEDFSRLTGPWEDPWSSPSLYVSPERLRERSEGGSKQEIDNQPKSPNSSRPSLEGNRPSSLEIHNMANRSKSANARTRPSSVYMESNIDSLREKVALSKRTDTDQRLPSRDSEPGSSFTLSEYAIDDSNISSNVEYLKTIEAEDSARKRSGRHSSGSKHQKMSSLSSISLSNTKNLFAGKFGDAFRRFEASNSASSGRSRSVSPDRTRGGLTPITGSVATGDRSDDGDAGVETAEIPQETKRELERRRLSREERRVAAAGAEYRQRLASRDDDNPDNPDSRQQSAQSLNRATSIQNKVQSLLDKSNEKAPSKTVEGYGRFTDPTDSSRQSRADHQPGRPPSVDRKPIPPPKDDPPSYATRSSSLAYSKTRPPAGPRPLPYQQYVPTLQTQAPSAPPKPKLLRKRGTGDLTIPSPTKPSHLAGRPVGQNQAVAAEDWETDFSKRYPPLTGLDMVERNIEKTSSSLKGPRG